MVAAAHVLDEADVRLISTSLRNPGGGPEGQSRGRQLVYGWREQFQTDPHGRDLILFYEAFHSDSGAGIGASYHTGWTGAVVALIKANGALPGWLQQIQHTQSSGDSRSNGRLVRGPDGALLRCTARRGCRRA